MYICIERRYIYTSVCVDGPKSFLMVITMVLHNVDFLTIYSLLRRIRIDAGDLINDSQCRVRER